jgi:hypothetical protein
MAGEEQRLQIYCVTWYNLQYGDGRLYSNYNNPRSAVGGMIAKKMGLRAGVADLSLMLEVGKIAYIELKITKGVQSAAQKDFEQLCKAVGAPYFIARSIEDFQKIIEQLRLDYRP